MPRKASIGNSPSHSKMPSAKEIVQETVAQNGVVVYSKSYCPYCTSTKSLLRELGVNFALVELDRVSDGDDLQSAIQQITGQRTVPNTFINGKSVGGNSDIQALHKAGKLVPLLQQVGALA